jgi:hypothetical protein
MTTYAEFKRAIGPQEGSMNRVRAIEQAHAAIVEEALNRLAAVHETVLKIVNLRERVIAANEPTGYAPDPFLPVGIEPDGSWPAMRELVENAIADRQLTIGTPLTRFTIWAAAHCRRRNRP